MSAMRAGGGPLAPGGLAFELAKKWWVLLVRGIVLIIIGILAFISPATWIFFVGAYMLIDGMAMLISGLTDQPVGSSRWYLIIVGILGLVAGLYLFWNPVVGGIALTWVIAAWAIITGILEIITAVRLREEIENEWWLILTGILAIIFGILAFQNVLAGFLAIATVFGVFAILAGIFSVVLALRVRDFGTQIGAVR